MKEIQRIDILDVPIDCVTQKEALDYISLLLEKKNRFQVITPNPEIVLEAQKNPTFKKVLKEAELSVADGVGIIWAAQILHGKSIKRVTGVDLMRIICRELRERRVFLLGASEEVNIKTKQILEKKYPGIKIVGNYSGTPGSNLEKIICNMINKSKAEILFVAYGAPNQELWIARNLPHLTTVKVAMGIGGAFDFISGHKKRAPEFLRKIGLEWLFRLIIEPSRYKRILNATVVFPLKVWKRKLIDSTEK
jgi:N-acetylglucosaminyldiphosphoundecaprenol N-acetyl-beta-D-mannosaminyltransferase